MNDPLERVIRPIVEGQIRGFIKEHPSILRGVDWYKKSTDKAATLTGSLAKRIVLDLLCKESRSRIEGALFEIWETEESVVAPLTAADVGSAGTDSGLLTPPAVARHDAAGLAPVTPRIAGASAHPLLPPVYWGQA